MTLSALPQRVKVCEMGPRDGLQNERGVVSTADKIRFIDLLSRSGLPLVETTSFVHPGAIPQLADAEDVMAGIARRPGVTYLCLVPNLRGLERARSAGVRAIAVFTAASESFAKRNVNMTIGESLAAFRDVVKAARSDGMWIRGYVSTAFGCPYEGDVPVENVVRVASALADLGVDEISIGDTIGVGTPNQVVEIAAALQAVLPVERLAFHFHDTRGTALANVVAALQMHVAIFDSSCGGLGGCPFAPGATGNLATEDLLYLLHGMGIETGVGLEAVRDATRFISGVLQRDVASRAYNALETQLAART
ncbi:MAG: hydroxymethylglutaryl-CoA lyase [Candidatus Baltobacteraceae bacterium]